MTQATKLILDYVYAHEKERANQVFLTQPLGGARVADYTWAQTLDQARRMATHLQSLGYEPGARIGILSKNCAHFFMAELAIWMAGYTTVAIFPTESAQTWTPRPSPPTAFSTPAIWAWSPRTGNSRLPGA